MFSYFSVYFPLNYLDTDNVANKIIIFSKWQQYSSTTHIFKVTKLWKMSVHVTCDFLAPVLLILIFIVLYIEVPWQIKLYFQFFLKKAIAITTSARWRFYFYNQFVAINPKMLCTYAFHIFSFSFSVEATIIFIISI